MNLNMLVHTLSVYPRLLLSWPCYGADNIVLKWPRVQSRRCPTSSILNLVIQASRYPPQQGVSIGVFLCISQLDSQKSDSSCGIFGPCTCTHFVITFSYTFKITGVERVAYFYLFTSFVNTDRCSLQRSCPHWP